MMAPESRPALTARSRLREDRLTGRTVLLAPERGLMLSASAAAVLKLCDARRTFAEIIEQLASSTGGERATIAADVSALLETLAERGLVTWQTP
jgi:pyrroloquinoline quinone biosynthesis protein D